MDQMYETASPELDAGKKKKKKLPRILGVILIILAPFVAAAALMPRDSAPEEAPSAFDPYSGTEARQYLEFNMLTDPVATFTLGENHGIYVAFQADDTGMSPFLVCLSQADFDSFSEIYAFTFDDRDLSQSPGTGTVYGYAVEIDPELEDYTLEYLEQVGMDIPSDEFSDYFGEYYLDTTLVKEQSGSDAVGIWILAAVLLALGLFLLLKKGKAEPPAVQSAPREDGAAAAVVDTTAAAQPAWEMSAPANPALGFLGAFLGSLVGAAVWIILYRLGYLAGIAGYLAVFCAIAGYKKLGGGEIRKLGTVLCVLIAILVMVLSNGLAYAWSMADWINAANPGRASIGYILTNFGDIMTSLDMWRSFWGDLVIGLVLALVAGISPVVQAFKRQKKAEN